MNFSAEERVLIRGDYVAQPESLQGWYPVLLRENALWWRFLGEKKFSEPFFYYTLSGLPSERRFYCRTSFAALREFKNPLTLAAFVFHVSRCGSTLLTQLLSTLSSCSVLSEPPVLDSFLRFYHSTPCQDGVEMLRQIVGALAQKRFADERHFVVKLDSWHISSLPLFRKAYPEVPFIFIYRRPGEVMASHKKQRGRQMVPGLVNAAMPGFEAGELAPGDLDGYCERVLEHFFAESLRHENELIFMNYTQLPGVVWNELLDFLSIDASEEEIKAMQLRAGSHSKNGGKFFADAEAPVSEKCDPYYQKLEKLRLEQGFLSTK